ncbi:unnamed protein product, partial [marine sediment metagenome]
MPDYNVMCDPASIDHFYYKALGTKGIEGKDWEWRKCPRCQGKGGA